MLDIAAEYRRRNIPIDGIIQDWQVFRNQISAGLNFCLSGIPFWSNDIGGFHVQRYGGFPGGCENPGYRELYARWFQYATFTPIFRAHGTDTPREIWRFGEAGSWAYEMLLKYLKLRYRLLPYIYSLAWKVTNDGYTMMRALPMDFTTDKNVFSINDQFMFGPALLINPVTEHAYFGEDYSNELIPIDQLFTSSGEQGGFTAHYFNGVNFDTLMVDSLQTEPLFDLYLGKDLPTVVRWDKNSKRWSGSILPKISGDYEFWLTSDDAVRCWIDEKLWVDNWNQRGKDKSFRFKIKLVAGKYYPFKVEQARLADATKLRLGWRTPEMKQQSINPLEKSGLRKIYLPASVEWYDFWTGEKFKGGKTIERETPIDIMPIYVRAGSLLPLGPDLQYADEKSADPIELRIYPGADATFEIYEDEGDNYNYEQGAYSIIPIYWNDKTQTLTIEQRKGIFPGMRHERIFHVLIAGPTQGIAAEITKKPDALVTYRGKKMSVKF